MTCFPEIPEDSIIRKYPFILSIYRSIIGDVSDKIKGVMTPHKAWKRKEGEAYPAEILIGAILQALGNPLDFITYAWNLDVAFKDVEAFRAKLPHIPPELITNLQVTKLPIDLIRAAAEPQVKAITATGIVEAPLANFWLSGQLVDFSGWAVNLPEVDQICRLYQMPSIYEKLKETTILTEHCKLV